MGMVRTEVKEEVQQASSFSAAVPSFTGTPPTTQTVAENSKAQMEVTNLPPTPKSVAAISKEIGMTRGGVSHDAAQIVAAMSAMKTDDEVLALFTKVYRHILATVLE